MTAKERFIEIFKTNIKREGADKLLEYLCSPSSDFFSAPASAKYHSAYKGGLCEHSLNVYDCLHAYVNRPYAKEKFGFDYTEETIAIVSLLHDICKTNVYKEKERNVKNEETGKWEKAPFFEFDDELPYGHGEKSVYMITPFMKLTREEAFAIRYHMGFANLDDTRGLNRAYEMFPLCLAVSTADMEATYYLENEKNKKA